MFSQRFRVSLLFAVQITHIQWAKHSARLWMATNLQTKPCRVCVEAKITSKNNHFNANISNESALPFNWPSKCQLHSNDSLFCISVAIAVCHSIYGFIQKAASKLIKFGRQTAIWLRRIRSWNSIKPTRIFAFFAHSRMAHNNVYPKYPNQNGKKRNCEKPR